MLELRQVTAAHEQSPVRYEAVIRNEGTEPAGWGQLYLDVPNDFAWALQYDPMLCFHYESEDLDCEVFALPPGEQVVYAFDYVVQAPPGDYQVTATYNPFRDPVPQALMTSSVTTSVGPSAELQVAWSQLRSGADLVRRATVRSFGPSIATGVALTLTWQASRGTSVPASVTSSQGSCDPPTATSTQCALGELSPFGTATVDLRFRGRGPRGLTTTAEVTSLTFDQDLSTNTATLST